MTEQLGWQRTEVSTIRLLRRIPGQQWDRLNASKHNEPHLRESLILLEREINASKTISVPVTKKEHEQLKSLNCKMPLVVVFRRY